MPTLSQEAQEFQECIKLRIDGVAAIFVHTQQYIPGVLLTIADSLCVRVCIYIYIHDIVIKNYETV